MALYASVESRAAEFRTFYSFISFLRFALDPALRQGKRRRKRIFAKFVADFSTAKNICITEPIDRCSWHSCPMIIRDTFRLLSGIFPWKITYYSPWTCRSFGWFLTFLPKQNCHLRSKNDRYLLFCTSWPAMVELYVGGKNGVWWNEDLVSCRSQFILNLTDPILPRVFKWSSLNVVSRYKSKNYLRSAALSESWWYLFNAGNERNILT